MMPSVKDLHGEVLNMRKGLHDVREKVTKNTAIIESLALTQNDLAKELGSKMSWKLFIPFFVIMAGIVGGMFGLVYNEQKSFRESQQTFNQQSGDKIGEIYGFIEFLKKNDTTLEIYP